MDRRPISFRLDLPPDAYRRIVAEQYRRRLRCQHISMRAIVIELVRTYLPEEA